MTPAIEFAGVTKEFPAARPGGAPVVALADVSLRVAPGEIVGLLGPNGSGKSTALKLLLGLLPPTRGACRLFDRAPSDRRSRERVGFLAEAAEFPRYLTARELVAHAGRLHGLDRATAAARADELLAWCGLAADADRRLATFSKGMRQRAGLAQALVHAPDLVILDEPTTGLDPLGVAEFGRLVRDLRARGATVLLSSHHLAQVEALCDRVVVLHRGRVVADEPLEAIRGPRRLEAFPVEGGGPLERRFLALVGATTTQPRPAEVPVFTRRATGDVGPAASGASAGQSREARKGAGATRSTGPSGEPVSAATRRAPAGSTDRVSGGTVGAAARRVALVAGLTLRDAARQRAPYLALLGAALLLGGAHVLRGFNFGASELKFLRELGLGAISLCGSALAVALAAQGFSGELERGGATWQLATPLRRAEYVAGKFFGVWLVLAGFVAVLATLLGGQLAARAFELAAATAGGATSTPVGGLGAMDSDAWLACAVAAGALVWKLGVVAALTLALGSWVRAPLLVLALGGVATLAGHLQPIAQHAWVHAGSPLGRAAAAVFALLLPDLTVFDLGGAAAGGETVVFWAGSGYGAVYAGVFVALAVAVFRRREL